MDLLMNHYVSVNNKFAKILSGKAGIEECVKVFDELTDAKKLLFYKFLIFLNDENLDKGCHLYGVNRILFDKSDLWKNPPLFKENKEGDIFSDDMYFMIFKEHCQYAFEYQELTKDSFDEKVKQYNEYFQLKT